MAKIIIGQEYEKEFKSICSLYGGGFLSGDIQIKRAKDNLIQTPAHTFVFDADKHGVNGTGDGENRELCFGPDGASWFAQLRGEDFDSGNADWKQLIMDVAFDYHRHYSLIEFKKTADRTSLTAEDKIKRKFKEQFIDKVFADGAKYVISDLRTTEPDNFYAVAMRLEINGGGESAPVLAKVYFRETANGALKPVSSNEGKRIDAYIDKAVPSEDGGGDDRGTADVTLVGKVFNALDKTFKSGKFSSYVTFNGKNAKKIDNMLSNLATSEVKELECTNVKVLGISHVEWDKSVYNISYMSKNILKLIIGINGYVSLACVNCGSAEMLVDCNVINFKNGKSPDDVCSVLDFGADNLGLTSYDLEAVREYGALSEHLFTISCAENPRNKDCGKIMCLNQTVEIEDGQGHTVRKCRGCRYPEIIFNDIFDDGAVAGKYTPDLNFDSHKLSLTSEETKFCPCCGREFIKSSLGRGGLCRFCLSDEHTPEAKELYKKYGNMLGLSVRFFHLFSKKYCREEDNIILFELGNDKYVFDKLNVRERGYIKSPVKFRRRGGRR